MPKTNHRRKNRVPVDRRYEHGTYTNGYSRAEDQDTQIRVGRTGFPRMGGGGPALREAHRRIDRQRLLERPPRDGARRCGRQEVRPLPREVSRERGGPPRGAGRDEQRRLSVVATRLV